MSSQMSVASKMIMLLRNNEKIQRNLEESLIVMRENNVELDTLSKSDRLTGIYNRRGFTHEAEKLLKKCRKDKRPMHVLYADMNNLKIINDRYGHDEGDFSLKMIGKILETFTAHRELQLELVEMNLLLPEENITLEEALNLADERLYEAKQYRKKEVAKSNKGAVTLSI